MKLPILGFNSKHSYIDFETTYGQIRFGIEELKLFVENVKTGARVFLTDASGNLIAPMVSDNIDIVAAAIATLTATDLNSTNGTFDAVNVEILNTDTLALQTGTPVNAVAADKILILGASPAEGETVTIGDKVYKFRLDALGAGVAATGTLTFNTELPHDGDTVILGNTTYIFKTALSTEPTVANEILIEATVTLTIDNLVSAVTGGAGEGTKYSVDTVSQGAATGSKASADTFLMTYNSVGYLGNQYDTLGTLTHATWGDKTLVGGIDAEAANDIFMDTNAEGSIDNLVLAIMGTGVAGTNYGTGTVAHTLVNAVKKDADEMTVTAKTKGVAGNAIALAETLSNAGSKWTGDAVFLSGGLDGTVAVKGAMFVDTTYLYYAIAANTITGTNWRRIALGSAY